MGPRPNYGDDLGWDFYEPAPPSSDQVLTREIPNPAIALDRDFGFVHAVAFTDKGMIQGPSRRSRTEALKALADELDRRGARL